MDKYTKTINALKKEYINLKLFNTHNKFSNNKLINGGTDLDVKATDAAISTDTTLQPINKDPSTIVQNPKKNKIIKGSTSMLDFLSDDTTVNLDDIPDDRLNFYYGDNLGFSPKKKYYPAIGSMILYDEVFIT